MSQIGIDKGYPEADELSQDGIDHGCPDLDEMSLMGCGLADNSRFLEPARGSKRADAFSKKAL